ncbi:hypothetical protein [Schauerella aestuarii]|uniref:hypothetical protein n=1 Tax=Schauerella aestuarii TaxID=2511204 RepID=UPI00136C5F2F|nr:hypothetical protein [Achromobacter aestuarii]MYZ46028.1 hypothetical protein [Achromobacter aestuarii]
MKIAMGVASLMFIWTANVAAQAAPGTIPEVPATPAQGDGAQRQQRPAEELKSKTPTTAPLSTPSRSDSMRSRERSFPNDVTPPTVPPPNDGIQAPAPAPTSPSPMPGLPMPDKSAPAPTPGDRG